MSQKCCVSGCDNEIDVLEASVGMKQCHECEKLYLEARDKGINLSLCKSKQDLIKNLENKNSLK